MTQNTLSSRMEASRSPRRVNSEQALGRLNRGILRLTQPPVRSLSSAVAHAPDGAVAVFADKQAAVFCNGDSDRATPHFAVGRDETSDKIFVFTGCFTGRVIERH